MAADKNPSPLTGEMDREAVLDQFREAGALLEGHFILSSGLRSNVYLQCARVLMNARRAERLCAGLAERVRESLDGPVDMVVSPAMGGVIVGYEMGRQLGVDSIFTERVEGRFQLRRGFAIPEGARVLMVEDVVTTGLSSLECIDCINANGGRTVGAACLVDRSNGAADVGVPLISLLSLDAPAYKPDEIPDWLAQIPPEKPGSRGMK